MASIIEPSEGAMSAAIEDEVVLMNLNAPETHFYGLRGAGVRIWELIEARAHTGDEIADRLLETYRGDAEAVRSNVRDTLEHLAQHALIAPR